MLRRRSLLAYALILACTGAAPPDAAAPVSEAAAPASTTNGTERAELIAADERRSTPAGVSYIAPAGWTSRRGAGLVVLTAQEGDAHVALIDAVAREPDAAVAEAWQRYGKQPPPLRLATDQPAREGWEQIRQYDYDTPPNAKRTVVAAALRHGSAWAVGIWDGADATFSKRGAQFGVIQSSLRPEGYQRESFAGRAAHALDTARLAQLDELIELGLRELGIPGASAAVVQGGKVVHARGYGVRQLGKATPVDADTLFPIASNTKAMTTLLLAQLVDEQKLRWDQPVVEAYPGFALGDASTTSAVRVEHLVCACTGLPRKDLGWLFEFEGLTPSGHMSALAHLQPTTKFGETYQYSNALAAAGGYVAAHAVAPGEELGKAYDAAMQARLFEPLGMRTTTFDFGRALRGNHALPHGRDLEQKPQEMPMAINYSVLPLRPAGGAWSSARELLEYVRLELGKGVAPSGKRLVSEQNLLQRWQPYVQTSEHSAYGMGLELDESRGIRIISHSGSLFGFKSRMLWLPESNVGAVLLTNSQQGGALLEPFGRRLLELLFDGKPEAVENLTSRAKISRESLAKWRAEVASPPDASALAALATHYQAPELGKLSVLREGPNTIFDFGEWRSVVGTRRNDDGTTSFVTISPGFIGFNFVVGRSTGAEQRTLTLLDAQAEYVFVEGSAPKAGTAR